MSDNVLTTEIVLKADLAVKLYQYWFSEGRFVGEPEKAQELLNWFLREYHAIEGKLYDA